MDNFSVSNGEQLTRSELPLHLQQEALQIFEDGRFDEFHRKSDELLAEYAPSILVLNLKAEAYCQTGNLQASVSSSTIIELNQARTPGVPLGLCVPSTAGL